MEMTAGRLLSSGPLSIAGILVVIPGDVVEEN